MRAIAVIFAGGVGRRASTGDAPKQFLEVGGRPIIGHTLDHFERHQQISAIYVACLAEWIPTLEQYLARAGLTKVRAVVPGGQVAQQSILNALRAAAGECEPETLALVHDGVRPIITADLISALIAEAGRHGNAVTCVPAAETLLVSSDGSWADELLPRSRSYIAQAPQAFGLGALLAAHEQQSAHDLDYRDVVDSATLMARFGHRIHLVAGNHDNLKVTYPVDVEFLRGWLGKGVGP